jgi:hypothetical protein
MNELGIVKSTIGKKLGLFPSGAMPVDKPFQPMKSTKSAKLQKMQNDQINTKETLMNMHRERENRKQNTPELYQNNPFAYQKKSGNQPVED